MNFEIGGAGSELSKHWRHRDEWLFIRHRYYYYYYCYYYYYYYCYYYYYYYYYYYCYDD